MSGAALHFYGDLNDFLPAQRRDVTFSHSFPEQSSIKDLVESLGVPHPEVACMLVNGRPVDFSYLVRDGDTIAVYPASTPPEGSVPCPVLRPPPAPRFVLDTHLGRLAAYLRMLGFDTLYWNYRDDEDLARCSSEEGRILLTRDLGLLKRGIVVHGAFVRATDPQVQILEILRRFDLFDLVAPFGRCMRCNGDLTAVSKEEVAGRVPPLTQQVYDTFWSCQSCGQVFWAGSHYQRMSGLIEQVMQAKERR
ncbi:MAG: Mut7-C RNAse domain-containing protein [Roseiflexaceae bacterium]